VGKSIPAPTLYKSVDELHNNSPLSIRQKAYYLVIQSNRAVRTLIVIITQLLNYDIPDPLTINSLPAQNFVKCFSLPVFWAPAGENYKSSPQFEEQYAITISSAIDYTSCPQGGWIMEYVMDNAWATHPSKSPQVCAELFMKGREDYRGGYNWCTPPPGPIMLNILIGPIMFGVLSCTLD
jgi:hypothetical protein